MKGVQAVGLFGTLALGAASGNDELLLNHCGINAAGEHYMKDQDGASFYTMDESNRLYCNMWLFNATGAGMIDGMAALSGERSSWDCDKAKALALSQLTHDCGIGGEKPGPAPKPTAGPEPSGGYKWSWATTTSDPSNDWDQRFCGKEIPGINENGGSVTSVAIPWSIICGMFAGKQDFMNHICPKCAAGTDTASCATANSWMASQWAHGVDGTVNTYEKIITEKNGLYANGLCFELQPLKFSVPEFNPNDFEEVEGVFGGGQKSLQGDDVLSEDWDSSKSVIAYMAVGCGGNCTGTGSGGGQVSSCPTSNDCVNGCVVAAGATDPCAVKSAGPPQCSFLNMGNTNGWNWGSSVTQESSYNAGSCPGVYDANTGNYTETAPNFRNWCLGDHMHFDLVRIPDFGSATADNMLVRYRPVVCPE